MDTKAQKEELMKVLCPSTYQAYQWLQINRSRFTGYIYGPVMMEINCEKTVEVEIESVIERDLMSFICENSYDMNLFLRTVRDNMKLPINVCLAPENCHLPVRENFPYDDHMSVLLEKVEGPYPVLNYLCNHYSMHDKGMHNTFKQSSSTGLQLEAALYPTEFNNDYEAGCSTTFDPSESIPFGPQLNILDFKKDEATETPVSMIEECNKMTCNVCGKQLKTSQTLSRHLIKVHGVNTKGDAVRKPVKEKVVCVFCDKNYANNFSLQRHLETVHLYDENKTQLYNCSKCPYKTSRKDLLLKHATKVKHDKENVRQVQEMKKFKCPKCDAQFTFKCDLYRHKKKNHVEYSKYFKICRKCPLCNFSSSKFLKGDMYKHFAEVHSVSMKWENLEFNSEEEFQIWKEKIEKTTITSYVKSKTISNNLLAYKCNRCGTYQPKGKGLRYMKLKGSCKINLFCPSEIKVKKVGQSLKVKFQAQHLGHKKQLEHVRLSIEDRRSIALKLINKVPKKEILRSIRTDSANTIINRIHLTNPADIDNIKVSLNLQDDWRKHKSDVISTEAWVNELKKSKTTSVLVYKPQGELVDHLPEFEEKDFLLIYMTEVQKLVLKKHGKDTVCVDSTFGLNNYNFQMYTLLTLDETREGFPVAFMFTNRSDEKALKRFYSEILNATGAISTNIFMSDMDETLYSAWITVMGHAEKRLFCAWHVIRALKKNIKKKIRNKAIQEIMERTVTSLVYERDETTFYRKLQSFLDDIGDDSNTKLFKEYFREYYVRNDRFKLWAYCFRLHCGINTNMSLENFNKVLKYFYLQGKKVFRMDQAVFAIVNVVRDKVYDILIKKTKGKITTKLRLLRNAHRRSLSIDRDNILFLGGNTWRVLSSTQTEFYSVQKLKNCRSCKLLCSHCNSCFHEFSCSCFENSIKNNMCKHIHAVCRTVADFNPETDPIECQMETDGNINANEDLEIEDIMEGITDANTDSFGVEKNRVIENFKAMLTALEPKLFCKDQLKFLKIEMDKISSVVGAIGSTDGKAMEIQSVPGTSTKIVQQRRFMSTKKKTLKTNRLV